jgi:hypothetical protein
MEFVDLKKQKQKVKWEDDVKTLHVNSSLIKIDARGHFCVEFMDKKTTIIQKQCK